MCIGCWLEKCAKNKKAGLPWQVSQEFLEDIGFLSDEEILKIKQFTYDELPEEEEANARHNDVPTIRPRV
jgi:hypothetical protein